LFSRHCVDLRWLVDRESSIAAERRTHSQDRANGTEVQLSNSEVVEILTKNKGLYDIMFMPDSPAD
jgi:hypothetical protein